MKVKEENQSLIVILLWFLWSERNIVREERRSRSAEILARAIRIYAAEISKQQEGAKVRGEVRTEKEEEKWNRPPEGVLKLNRHRKLGICPA